MISAFTAPEFMSVTRRRSDSSWFTGATSSGSVIVIVEPTLPSCWLMAMAMAWTTGGCPSPAMTIEAPRFRCRSRAIAATSLCPPLPASSARAHVSTSDGFTA
jgi:hypothetical protein